MSAGRANHDVEMDSRFQIEKTRLELVLGMVSPRGDSRADQRTLARKTAYV